MRRVSKNFAPELENIEFNNYKSYFSKIILKKGFDQIDYKFIAL